VDLFFDHLRALEKNRAGLHAALGSDRPWRRARAQCLTYLAVTHLQRGERWAAVGCAMRAIAGGSAEAQAYKCLLEGLLSPAVYEAGKRTLSGALGRS
jgi:hypothetical protein